MPLPLAAAGAIAAVMSATHDCDYGTVDDENEEAKKDGSQTTSSGNVVNNHAAAGEEDVKYQKSVRFSQQNLDRTLSTSEFDNNNNATGKRIRSVESEASKRSSFTSILWKSNRGVGSQQSSNNNNNSTPGNGVVQLRRAVSPTQRSLMDEDDDDGMVDDSHLLGDSDMFQLQPKQQQHQQAVHDSGSLNRSSSLFLSPPAIESYTAAATTAATTTTTTTTKPTTSTKMRGFVDGDFSSGKIHDVLIEPSSCWVMAYHPFHPLLVVGLSNDGLAFFDTHTYSLIHRLEQPTTKRRRGAPPNANTAAAVGGVDGSRIMISALKWIGPVPMEYATDTLHNSNSFISMNLSWLAVASLSGRVALYSINMDILESQGPTHVVEAVLSSPILSMDASLFFGKSIEPCLCLATGEKNGTLTVWSLPPPQQGRIISMWGDGGGEGVVEKKHYRSSILAVAIHAQEQWLAVGTKVGQVLVYRLLRQNDGVAGPILIDQRQKLWQCQRNGPIRSIVAVNDTNTAITARTPTTDKIITTTTTKSALTLSPLHLAFGGYDKTVVLVDTALWAVSRELVLQGTINTIVFDPQQRFLGVGCRDRSFTLFDTTTFIAIKTFQTPGWVTCISWENSSTREQDVVAIRSDHNCISVLDLTPISRSEVRLSSRHGMNNSSLSWSHDGRFVARTRGHSVVVADAWYGFRDVQSTVGELRSIISKIAFGPQGGNSNHLAAVDESGNLYILVLVLQGSDATLQFGRSRVVTAGSELKALAWSPDGVHLAVGGKDKRLHIVAAHSLEAIGKPIDMRGRIWDIDYVPGNVRSQLDEEFFMAVALGDYTALILNESFEPMLQVSRSRTVRCLHFHPFMPVIAVGDGAGTIAMVNYYNEEVIHEIDAGERVSSLDFSPLGDFLVFGTDDCRFVMYETATFKSVQEVPSGGFALSASFSPDGLYLALGSANESYSVVRLGPFLGIDLVPMERGLELLPPWAMNEALHRSPDHAPSLVQRQMAIGGSESLRRLASIFRDYPATIFTVNRSTQEGCFDTALLLKKANLLKLAVTTLVDGTLDGSGRGNERPSILTTGIPQRGRDILDDIIRKYPPDFAVEICNQIAFVKVPFAEPRVVSSSECIECGSRSYIDPWTALSLDDLDSETPEKSIRPGSRDQITRTPAVLPLPGLGEMDFLATLLNKSPADVFDNEAFALVLRVLWNNHIGTYFYIDCLCFLAFYGCWIALVEANFYGKQQMQRHDVQGLALLTLAFNTIYTVKEVVQSRYGRRESYFCSLWNAFDILSILGVYSYIFEIYVQAFDGAAVIPLAVVSSLILTVKVLSYLRGFSGTAWLISVLTANFRDTRGFLIILFIILVGFSIAFRQLFGDSGDEGYSTLRRSFLSTFQATITGTYDPAMLFMVEESILAIFTFVLAVTCVLVVALNALISILSDSFARVQEHAIANRRRERAALIVEYMSLLPPWKRRRIERETKWFHTLLEVDADGDLLIQKDDWEGGLNALRRDLEELTQAHTTTNQKALQQLKADFDGELSAFKKEVMSMLRDLSTDVKHMKKMQAEGGITFSGKNVAKAVRAVQLVGRQGGNLFHPHEQR